LSLLVDTAAMGPTAQSASERLFTRAHVAAGPMIGWEPCGSHSVRLIFAHALISRFSGLGAQSDTAFDQHRKRGDSTKGKNQ
jgi:hypothetical protein